MEKHVKLTAKVRAIADTCSEIFTDRELVESVRYRRLDDRDALVSS